MQLPRLEAKYRSYNKVITAMEKSINEYPPPGSDDEASRLEQEMKIMLRDHHPASERVVAVLRYAFRVEQVGRKKFVDTILLRR